MLLLFLGEEKTSIYSVGSIYLFILLTEHTNVDLGIYWEKAVPKVVNNHSNMDFTWIILNPNRLS